MNPFFISYHFSKGSTLLPILLICLMWIAGCSLLKDKDEPCICPPSIAGASQALSCDCEPDLQLAFDSEAAWSPDGSTIAYMGTGNDSLSSFGIHLVDSDGTNKRLFHAGVAGAPAWSSDGHWIAFHEGAHIYKKHVTSDSLVQLTLEGRNFYPAWSPDGQFIAYDRSMADDTGPAGIWLMNQDGKNRRAVIGGAFPFWHPNGEKFIAVIGTSSTSIWKRFIQHNPFSGQPLMTLDAVVNNENLYPKYSPDGTRIVFQSQPSGKRVDVWVMNADGSGRRQLTEEGAINPAWSPDGQWIVYTETQKTGRLWLMRPDGSGKHQRTFE